MKKITLSVALLLGSLAAKAQTEYIDITSKKPFGRSEMVLYNDDTNYYDLEYFYLSRFTKNYHWVKYTDANKIILSLNDDKGDKREICTKQDTFKVYCQVYDSFAQQLKINVSTKVFQVWISKPLK
mgnify:FL=1|tara:strand:- start:1101 stop:1478 length:378 start_codon:yes stop_codon:yes gene_type:complete